MDSYGGYDFNRKPNNNSQTNSGGKIMSKLVEKDGSTTKTTTTTTYFENEKIILSPIKKNKFAFTSGDRMEDENIKNQAVKFDDNKPVNVDESSEMIDMSISRDEEENNLEFLLSKPVTEILTTFEYALHQESDFEAFFDTILIENRFIRLYKGKHKKIGNVSVLVLNDVKTKKQQFINLLKHLKMYRDSTKHHVLLKNLGCISFEKQGKVYLLFEPVLSTFQTKKDKNLIDNDFKFVTLFNLVEFIMECHESNKLQFNSLRFDNLLYNVYDDLRVLPPSDVFKEFNQNYENNQRSRLKDDDFNYNRYKSPELAHNEISGVENDIWVVGCLFVEMFSAQKVWMEYKEEDMMKDLMRYFVFKINKDIPKHCWSVICECINPFAETRSTAREILEHLSRLVFKLKTSGLVGSGRIEKYMMVGDMDKSALNMTVLDPSEDPRAVRKCPMHQKYEAYLFCAQCNEIMCETCKTTIHVDHSNKGVFFEYLEYINLANGRIHTYKDKFNNYCKNTKLPNETDFLGNIDECLAYIEKKYRGQKETIEQQFAYLIKIIIEMKELELSHLSRFKDHCSGLYLNLKQNFSQMKNDISYINHFIDQKEENFIKFQNLDQVRKEEVMKNVTLDENRLSDKKKDIIKNVTVFQKDNQLIDKIKRYFLMFIMKYKENKISDFVQLMEKRVKNSKQKYEEIDFYELMKLLIVEFEELSLVSSRNYFNSFSRDLFISIVNSNKIFSYNLDSAKFFITEVNFTDMPCDRFPNYSRSLIINGNLLVNGGYDEENKVTLPYFFFYDRINKTLTRLNDMLYGHSAHSIIFIPPHFVVVVSGSGIIKCEKFDMDNNEWVELPDTLQPRQNTTLFYFNKQYIYAFGGAYWDDKKKTFIYLDTVERLDLDDGYEWQLIKSIRRGENLNLKKSVYSVLSYDVNRVLLVGGSINYNTYSDEVMVFDFEKNEFSLKENIVLPKKTCFPNKTFMYTTDKAFQLDTDGNVFEFDFKKDKFTVLKENNILKSAKTNVDI